MVGGDDQVPVVGPAEPLRLALAAPVDQQVIEQVRPVSGPVAGHPGDADPAAARAADPHDGPGAARRPGAALGGLSPWPASSSKQMKAPRSRAVLLYRATPRPSTPRPPRRHARWPAAPGPGP